MQELCHCEGVMFVLCRNCVSTWSSGTGAAGLFGSLSYAGMTSAGLSARVSLLVILVVPAVMAVTYGHNLIHHLIKGFSCRLLSMSPCS